jgi:exosome complex component RRP42
MRPISIEKDAIGTAEGSAKVQLGNTVVMIGVKLDISEPFPDAPESGVLTTNAELNAMASPEFGFGSFRDNAIELARVVDRGIRESEAIALDKLCIELGKKVWAVYIDIHVLDYDGNLFDASTLGALSALTTTVIPASGLGNDNEDFKLPINNIPVSCTVVKFSNVIALDPTLSEENICDARLTVTTDDKGDIRAMQKGIGGSFTLTEIKDIIGMAQKTGQYIRENVLDHD